MVIGMVVDNELDGDVRVQNEARILAAAGHTVKILCLSRPGAPLRSMRDGYEILRVPMTRGERNKLFFIANTWPFFYVRWRKYIRDFVVQQNVEVLHAHDLYMLKPAWQVVKDMKVKLVSDLHENYPAAVKGYRWAVKFPNRLITRPASFEQMEKIYLPKADRIIVLSDSFQKMLHQKFPTIPERHFFVYGNVPDVETLEGYEVNEQILPEKGDSKIIFYFGGIAERRGIYTLISALSKLLQSRWNVKLLLIGPVDKAERKTFYSRIQKSDVKDHIIHYDWKDIKWLPSYIKASDVCVSPIVKNPQHESGVANKVFQYMLFERPVVVSNCKPQVDVVEEGACGLSFQSGDAADLAGRIVYLFKNQREAREMGLRGRELVKQKYNLRQMSETLVKMYKEMEG
jgi:glycosyltransferase involved in cell wall biosynthesis